MTSLSSYGWERSLAASALPSPPLPPGVPGRVVAQERDRWRVVIASGELTCVASGRLRRAARSALDLPLVGDWVLVSPPAGSGPAPVLAVLPRRTLLLRQRAGRASEAQGLAANADLALVLTAPDRDLAPRRVERYLTLLAGAGVRPAVVLNKADLVDDLPDLLEALRAALPGVPVLAISARTGDGFDELLRLLVPGETVVCLGSSGVGKSTLANRLLGAELQATCAVREQDDRGRHTTTRRELLLLPGGALLLDTPGLREVGPWSADGLGEAFEELEALAAECRFRDCTHEHEPGCAVLAAAAGGQVDPDRVESFGRLRRELERRESQQERRARYEARRRDRRERLEVRRRIAAREPGWE